MNGVTVNTSLTLGDHDNTDFINSEFFIDLTLTRETMIHPIFKSVIFDDADPGNFHLILDKGSSTPSAEETKLLVNYFKAAVNLSQQNFW